MKEWCANNTRFQVKLLKKVIIARDLGGTGSTGIEVLKLYHFLKETSSDFLFIVAYSEIQAPDVWVAKMRFPSVKSAIQKLVLIVLNIDLYAKAETATLKMALNDLKVDSILGLSSATDFYVLELLQVIKSHLGISEDKASIHFFDPTPAKPHWGENELLRAAKKRRTRTYLKGIGRRTCASKPMAAYMQSMYGGQFGVRYSAINPLRFKPTADRATEKKIVYYLGTLYGKRKADLLLQFIERQNIWELHLFGAKLDKTYQNVFVHDFVKDISTLEKPDLLIDLDIDEADVYIPGKSYTYLGSDVPILVISPLNSAIRDFYGIYQGTESNSLSEIGILACVNNSIQIQNAFNELNNFQAVDLHQFRDKQIQNIKKNHIGRDF